MKGTHEGIYTVGLGSV